MIHTEPLDLVWDFVTGTNETIFLTGKAGTGKTTFLKQLRDNGVKNMAVAAPTGVAAINAGGVTLHSMFHLPFGPVIPDNKPLTFGVNKSMLLSRLRYNQDKLNFFRSLELLIIDEASMVPCYLVDAIDTILRSVRHRKDLPFGGLQVLFIGDLYQLQPVLKQEEWKLLRNYYSSIFFFDSHVLRNNPPVVIELKKIFRQKDQSFIDILNGVRDNNLTKEQLNTLNSRLHGKFPDNKEEGVITLTTHNEQADTINIRHLRKLHTKEVKFKATIDGNFPEQMFPADPELVLKVNAQVMFVRNDTEGKRYFNGKIGIVTEIDDDNVTVRCGEEYIEVGINMWENITYVHEGETNAVKEEVVGTFSQFPLRLAWAITIHKSQGLTFEKVIIDAANAFVKGQVYVALSRATTLEGLVLTSPVNSQFMGAHEDLKKLHEGQRSDDELKTFLTESRKKFSHQLLEGIFTFDHLHYTLSQLKKQLEELEAETTWLNESLTDLNEHRTTADKFRIQVRQMLMKNPELEQNTDLLKRLSEASVYFIKQLKDFSEKLLQHPVRLKNKQHARTADKQFARIGDAIAELIARFNECKDGFTIKGFNNWKAKMKDHIPAFPSTYNAEKGKQKLKEETHTHEELYKMLAQLRAELAETEDVEPFRIFTNQAIRSCCEILPADMNSLLAVSGFGKQKVKKYGEHVIEVISDYCNMAGIEALRIDAPEYQKKKKKEEKLSETAIETLNLFKSGKTIEEIEKIRSLHASTIEAHLAVAVLHEKIALTEILSENEITGMKAIYDDAVKDRGLKYLYDLADGKYSYGKLRLMMAGLYQNPSQVQSE
jgi:guanylate kinase